MSETNQVILTTDQTLMSDHHGNIFLGFGACAPAYAMPLWLYRLIFFPPMSTVGGSPKYAPYSLRKVDAVLHEAGMDPLTVRPEDLHHHINGHRVLGISTMDPLGLGPASTTFQKTLQKGQTNSALHFEKMLLDPAVVSARKKGLKVIVGGPGAWQLFNREDVCRRLGIDCVVEGRFTSEATEVFHSALRGEELQQFVKTSRKAKADEIPPIRLPSINGLVEVGQGCVRGCRFCHVTAQPLRWMPEDRICREVEVNARWGLDRAVLHAEDVMLYGSRGLVPRADRLPPMIEKVKKEVGMVQWSHASIAAINAAPGVLEQCMEVLVDENQSGISPEIGIETGSSRLLAETMPQKASPFEPEMWNEMIINAAGIMNDAGVIPSCTLICGLPQETEDDVLRTIETIDELKWFTSLIVPLYFVPLGKLSSGDFFKFEDISPAQIDLLKLCLRRGIEMSKKIMRESVIQRWYGPMVNPMYWLLVGFIEHTAKSENLI